MEQHFNPPDVPISNQIISVLHSLVSAAVKGFNTDIVATAGHYCLLAATHAYYPENVALSMLRLMDAGP
ncbi:hypothetical protein BV898_16322 [Hypsibius exemplaris]|uniref:Uncharacterized protein n=1 Tax=Hypsibius exemplaris TaxID=2072580 RepID=A0A9X6RLC9_HYPEX|nr:hypothetical protein BV898_16322 [Hypsibius exemplaris]